MSGENPLLRVALPVPFDAVRPEHIGPAVDALLQDAEAKLAAIGKATPTYDATLGALDALTNELDWAVGLAGHLESVLGTPELRDAYNAVLPRVTEFYSRIVLSEPLYKAIRAFANTAEAKALDPVKARFLKKTLDDFRRNGAELPEAGKKRLAEIDVALSELTQQFSENVVDATATFELIVEDEARLAGLPEAPKEAARKNAESKGKSGFRFTLAQPSYQPAMTYLHDRALREALYRASSTRATPIGPGGAKHDNTRLIEQILALRQEKAKLLGFTHFADFVTSDRMAKNGDTAQRFVKSLHDKLAASFARENEELEAFATKNGHVGRLEPWDVAYWAEKQRLALYDFDEEMLRPYLPLDRVQRGLFEIAQKLYGVTIERDAEARVWHPDVTAWSVRDESGVRLGAFYMDLFPRETKRDGAWMGGVVDRLPGTRLSMENVAVVVANMTPPRAPGEPALLSHKEVETLFHEFGHMMHHVLSDVTVRSQAGTRVAYDFVELPSMIMENWTWAREALDGFACHHKTGAPIPEEMKDRMLRARTYRSANYLVRQLGFSTVDLALHTTYDPKTDGDVLAFARKVAGAFSPAPLPGDYAMLASFGHLFGGSLGYAAGYYSYQWSEVLEADAFSMFQKHGILSREAGRRFREGILSRGDTGDPAELYRAFLGRDPDVNALITRLGLAA